MEVKRYDMIVVGAGPAGLSAAIEAAKHGVKPIVFDENARPGGQLFKQIHKFLAQKNIKPRSEASRSEKNFSKKQRNMVWKLS